MLCLQSSVLWSQRAALLQSCCSRASIQCVGRALCWSWGQSGRWCSSVPLCIFKLQTSSRADEINARKVSTSCAHGFDWYPVFRPRLPSSEHKMTVPSASGQSPSVRSRHPHRQFFQSRSTVPCWNIHRSETTFQPPGGSFSNPCIAVGRIDLDVFRAWPVHDSQGLRDRKRLSFLQIAWPREYAFLPAFPKAGLDWAEWLWVRLLLRCLFEVRPLCNCRPQKANTLLGQGTSPRS